MQCVVIGITPPATDDGHRTAERVLDTVHFPGLQWQAGHHFANDYDNDGALTLLLTTFLREDEETEVTPNEVVEAVQHVLGSTHHAELWATAGAPLPLRPLEGYESHIVIKRMPHDDNRSTSLEKARQAMQEYGLIVQPQIMSIELVTAFRQVVEEAIANVETKLAQYRPSLRIGEDAFQFREIASRNKHRFDLRLDVITDGTKSTPPAISLVHRLLKESPFLQAFLCTTMGLDGCDASLEQTDNLLLSDSLDFDVSVVYSRPGASAQGWHADGQHLSGASEAGWNSINDGNKQLALPYAICLFVPLIDLVDKKVGYTQFWPGSHAHRKLAGMGPVACVTQSVWESHGCRAGDGILYDYRLMHQGMPHSEESVVELRPIVQIIFKQKSYVEKANYGSEPIAGTESTIIMA